MEEYKESPARMTIEEETGPQQIPGAGQPLVDFGAAASDFLRWTLDPTDKLERISHELKGEIPTIEGEICVWKEVEGRRMINDAGVNKIVFMIKPFFDKEVSTANIPAEEAHKITESTMHTIVDVIYLNSKEWKIDDSLYRALIQYIDNEIYLALTRIKEGGIVKIIKPTLRRIETYAPEQKKKSSLLSIFRKG